MLFSRFIPLLVGCLSGACLFAACQPHSATMPTDKPSPAPVSSLSRADGKFALSATPGTADGYPARIEEARFITPDGGSFPVPYGHLLRGNWGGGGTYWAVGDEFQAVPDSLEIRWFSYTENKFYEGHFLLPHERLRALLTRGLWDEETKSRFTYGDLDVCVVPTGVVVVWLSAGQSNKVLIGRYQAQEINYDYARFRAGVDRAAAVRETQAKLTPEVRHEIATGTLSSKKWDEYLKVYNWQLAFSHPLTLSKFALHFLDAEAISDPVSADMAAQAQLLLAPSPKPVPAYAMLYVAGPYGRKRLIKIKPFDEQQTLAAFRSLHAQHPQEVITLLVDADEKLTKATLSLRAGGQVIALSKTTVQLFDLP